MRPPEVQKKYLEIQQTLGQLVDDAPSDIANKLRAISVSLCNVKRQWIGTVDEIRTDVEV